MKPIKNLIKSALIGLFTFLSLLAVLYVTAPGLLHAASTALDPIFRSLQIMPAKSSNGTNGCFVAYSKDGTNYFRINPTNAVLEYMYLGTLYSGSTSNILTTNSTIGAKTLQFRNGILVGVQ